ncbi:mannose-6-phosphate isomerase, class I [Neolewinella aurantiaca]|uniref:mannose-6-phosphate isomerase n=1 Tax=Neolewinella aurantiaca TaxID=2602767 RepID=A0A5C7FI94_9BACT|nr:mannose-6-phosphate isomerase, class I [Neolewinella aurantiaca]TXF83705.1 mannose-6-phosphate isomerase, class I [Neolewinella aurantiaca]
MSAETNKPFLLDGVLQHYAWGGYKFLPQLLGQLNTERKPVAELWVGAHPKGPAVISGSSETLSNAIEAGPVDMLGEAVAHRFGGKLPFLFKVLDVREMLSIQVHPNKKAAEEGFAYEEMNGPAITAPNRNYRDDNHKPELGVALTDFYLLHGFRPIAEIHRMCRYIPGWASLIPILQKGGVEGLYRHVMEADQEYIDRMLQPIIDGLGPKQEHGREYPAFWAARAVERYSKDGHHDRGIFSLYWLNIVHLRPGEGIFQDAGIPHAYLQGTCIELMANSDNVLRGGLTPKHIDVTELLKHTSCEPVNPDILTPVSEDEEDTWMRYKTPAPDFALSVAKLQEDDYLTVDTSRGPSILFLQKGSISGDRLDIELNRRQRIAFVPAGLNITFEVGENTVVYRAEVGPADDPYTPGGIGHHVSDI